MDFSEVFSKNLIGFLTIASSILKDLFFTYGGFSQIHFGYSKFFNAMSIVVSIITCILCLNFIEIFFYEMAILSTALVFTSLLLTVKSFSLSRGKVKKHYAMFGLFSYVLMSASLSAVIINQFYKASGNVVEIKFHLNNTRNIEFFRVDQETNEISTTPIIKRTPIFNKTIILIDENLVIDERTIVILKKEQESELCRFFLDKSQSMVISDENC
jgi:predicted signal transduction protein with EAL and GGDEF domain